MTSVQEGYHELLFKKTIEYRNFSELLPLFIWLIKYITLSKRFIQGISVETGINNFKKWSHVYLTLVLATS